jgi:hypothetical protein
MRVQCFPEPRLPEEIPIAGVTLSDLLGEYAKAEEVQHALDQVRHKNPKASVQPGDEFRLFRTPHWTWALMSGLEAIAVIRRGRVVFWVVTRMN